MVNEPRREKIYIVDYFQVRRHSRILYIPLDPVIVDIYDIQKGDKIKAVLLEVIKQPRETEKSEEQVEAVLPFQTIGESRSSHSAVKDTVLPKKRGKSGGRQAQVGPRGPKKVD